MVLPPGARYMILARKRYDTPTFQNHSEVYLQLKTFRHTKINLTA